MTIATMSALRTAALVTALFASQDASAQISDYPSRAIKIIVPAPPGPLLDALPRMLADKVSGRLGQPVIIENRPGAAQNIGAEAVAKAEPDGYTLLVTPPGPLTVSELLFTRLGFDPRSFVPITVLVTLPTGFVANPGVPAATLADLLVYAKANPGRLNFGSPGAGSTPHLAMERFMSQAKVKLVHVPYQGFGPAMNDLLAGHIQVMIDNLGNAADHVKAGKLNLLAVNAPTRNPLFPGAPTASESVPGFVHSDWFALMAPPRTLARIAEKLSAAITETLKLPEIAKRLHSLSVTPVGNSPAQAKVFIDQERERWHQVISSSGLKLK